MYEFYFLDLKVYVKLKIRFLSTCVGEGGGRGCMEPRWASGLNVSRQVGISKASNNIFKYGQMPNGQAKRKESFIKDLIKADAQLTGVSCNWKEKQSCLKAKTFVSNDNFSGLNMKSGLQQQVFCKRVSMRQ